MKSFVRKNTGTPTAAAQLKQINWRLVSDKATFVFTRVKSLGTGTYGIHTSKNLLQLNNSCFLYEIQSIFEFHTKSNCYLVAFCMKFKDTLNAFVEKAIFDEVRLQA